MGIVIACGISALEKGDFVICAFIKKVEDFIGAVPKPIVARQFYFVVNARN